MNAEPGAATDALRVSGGGVFSVASTELQRHGSLLGEVADELSWCAHRITAIDASGAMPSISMSAPGPAAGGPGGWLFEAHSAARRADCAVDEAASMLRAASVECSFLATALHLAANGYTVTESLVDGYLQAVAAEIGRSLGFLTSTLGVVLVPGVIGALTLGVAALGAGAFVNPRGARQVAGAARAWIEARKELLSDPRFVLLVRLSAMSADDFGLGLLRMPQPLPRMLGDEGWGILGVDTSAAAGMFVGGAVGALRETPVTVQPVRRRQSTVVAGWSARAERIPTGPAQVRVDRYVSPGQPNRFEVYLGGTLDASTMARDQPWDMTSNVAGVAGRSSGAYRAVTAALRDAGVTPDSPLVVSGYSQGGLVGARLAASGDYNVRGLFTLGAPVGQVPVPATTNWVALEHTDDLVPAVGGIFASGAAVRAQRQVFRSEQPDGRLALPAHQLDRYRATAELADGAADRRLTTAAVGFAETTVGTTRVESTWYQAKRVRPGETPAARRRPTPPSVRQPSVR